MSDHVPSSGTPLPRLLVLTDGRATGGRDLVEVVRAAVDGGPCAVVLREKHLPLDERRRLADALGAIVPVLVVASDGDALPSTMHHAVHLSARAPWPAAGTTVVGRSCHDATSLAAATREGCAYATLSPIQCTASKPGYGPALGFDALRDAPLPVYALGGMDASNAGAAIAAGASGIAVLGAVMRAERPDRAVAALLGAIDAAIEATTSARDASRPADLAGPPTAFVGGSPR